MIQFAGIAVLVLVLMVGLIIIMKFRQNTSEVDGISGATMSSKTIKAAVRNALAQGIK